MNLQGVKSRQLYPTKGCLIYYKGDKAEKRSNLAFNNFKPLLNFKWEFAHS